MRRSNGIALGTKKYFIISGEIWFSNLDILVAWACIFLWWIEAELSFFNEDDLSLSVIFNAYSCKELILLLTPLLRNIQIKEQNPHWDVTNAFITVFLFSGHMYWAILASEFSFWLAFLQRLFMWSSKESLESKTTSTSSFYVKALLSI